MDAERESRYEVRDDYHAGPHNFGPTIYEHPFCMDCRSKECSNTNHNRIELHPIIRIPKKNASKKKWKIFFDLVAAFGKYNKRSNRH